MKNNMKKSNYFEQKRVTLKNSVSNNSYKISYENNYKFVFVLRTYFISFLYSILITLDIHFQFFYPFLFISKTKNYNKKIFVKTILDICISNHYKIFVLIYHREIIILVIKYTVISLL